MVRNSTRRQVRRPILAALAVLAAAGGLVAEDSPEAPTEKPKRLVFFAPAGPVVMDVEISTGNRTVDAIRSEYVEEMFPRLDKDQSGTLEASEWAGIPQVGGAPVQSMIPNLLTDGTLTREGFRKLLDQQLGPPFTIVARPKRLDQTVRLVETLDQDGDGRLSLDEVVHSADVLRRFDLDDDEAVSVTELQPFPASMRQAQQQQQADDPQVLPVHTLSTAEDFVKVDERIRNSYLVGPAELNLDRCGFQKSSTRFDADRSGGLNPEELRKWLEEGEPDVVVKVAFLADSRPARVTADAARSRRVAPSSKTGPRRWNVAIDGMELQTEAMDNRGRANDFVPLVNTRFLQSDADDNGYLNEQEYTGLQLPVPFALLDTNGDGMLMRDELQSYTKNLARLAQATVVLTVSDDAASLFQLIDEGEVLKNRLTSRELMTISTRLPRHDQNKDGVFDRGDFVSEYKLSFGYKVPDGFASQITATPGNATMPGRRPAPTRSGPLWFQRMDRNRDKDISWREFLGPRSTFDRLDTNRDGLIDKDEAEAAEPAVTSQADATSGS